MKKMFAALAMMAISSIALAAPPLTFCTGGPNGGYESMGKSVGKAIVDRLRNTGDYSNALQIGDVDEESFTKAKDYNGNQLYTVCEIKRGDTGPMKTSGSTTSTWTAFRKLSVKS